MWHGMTTILEAVRDHDRVAVRAGRKVSKTASGATLALWWAIRGGRVMVTAPTFATLQDPFWLELTHLAGFVSVHVPTRPSTPIVTPRRGRIIGRQAAKRENLQGPSGENALYIVEESSGVRRDIIEAIEGNVAGGGKILMLGNPTKLSGAYYDAFHGQAHAWHQIHLSSRDSPNVLNNDSTIPGLAIKSWIDEMELKHGADSPFVAIHVDGEFPDSGANSIVPLALVQAAEKRWTPTPPETGDLTLGVDVARSGDDESVIQPIRGTYAYTPTALRDQTGPSLGAHIVEIATRLRRGDELASVHVDVIGVGASVFDWLAGNAPDWMTVHPINVAEVATSARYHRLRDQLAFGVRTWLEEDAQLPSIGELRTDLVAGTYRFDSRGRYVTASKDELKEALGRSPDHGDALALATYTPPPPFEPAPPQGWE